MASERLIKRRIRSAKNISQITRAMQMVAASKMKKAQGRAIQGRPYSEKIAEMVSQFVARIEAKKHPLLVSTGSGKPLVVLISTNKGLVGGLNTNLFRSLSHWFSQEELLQAVFVTLGSKGERFLVHRKLSLTADFSTLTTFTEAIPALTTLITDGFTKGEYSEVYLVYSNFITVLTQEPTRKKILPIAEFATSGETPEKEEKTQLDFLVEPSVEAIINDLLFNYLENQVRDAVYEAEASEHSARMIAMKNATDNAMELMDLLTLEYNQARQEKITYEIADMVTARSTVQ